MCDSGSAPVIESGTELAQMLLHTFGNNGFRSHDREFVGAFVSSRNTCHFCHTSHGARPPTVSRSVVGVCEICYIAVIGFAHFQTRRNLWR
jgi:hypothetical protein